MKTLFESLEPCCELSELTVNQLAYNHSIGNLVVHVSVYAQRIACDACMHDHHYVFQSHYAYMYTQRFYSPINGANYLRQSYRS